REAQIVWKGDYEVATCKESATIEETLANVQPPSVLGTKVELVPMDGGVDRACRGSSQVETGRHAGLYDIWTAETLDACKALCVGKCTGIEYHAKGKYCE
ncbi:unnamed protein product, partial [Symbiodinium pilosum]